MTDWSFQRLQNTAQDFANRERLGGLLLILATILALIWANSPYREVYQDLLGRNFILGFEDSFQIELSIKGWVNDGLMAIFFLVVGMEIKRELLVGQLSSLKNASLPILAAVGGIVIPAMIFFLVNQDEPSSDAWGIPMATDIAYSLGILGLLGKKGTTPIKIFLTALAIADDLGAIAVIALFYSNHLIWLQLGVAVIIYLVLILMNFFDVKRLTPYIFFGILFWLCFIHSGIHPTIAGVLIAFVIPMKAKMKPIKLADYLKKQLFKIQQTDLSRKGPIESDTQEKSLYQLRDAAKETLPPLLRMENSLTGFNAYFVIPLFALVNAGVSLEGDFLSMIQEPLSIGIVAGLVLGKPLGILLFSWLGIQLGIAELPKGMDGYKVTTVGFLAGIGFTMSLFITNLAIDETSSIRIAKISVLFASFLAILLSALLFQVAKKRNRHTEVEA